MIDCFGLHFGPCAPTTIISSKSIAGITATNLVWSHSNTRLYAIAGMVDELTRLIDATPVRTVSESLSQEEYRGLRGRLKVFRD